MKIDRSRVRRCARYCSAAFSLAAFLVSSGVLAQTAEIAASVTDGAGHPVVDAVVVAVPMDGKAPLPSRPREEIVDQIDKEFAPKVKAVVVGTPIVFPNHDRVRHHVYSFSGAKQFELPLYAGIPAQPVLFDKPGVVVLGCNIHDWMVGYIYVADSPWFGKTDARGKVVLTSLPEKAMTLRVWHAQMEAPEASTRKTVDLAKGRRADIAWTLQVKPEEKIRRAPSASHAGHY